MFDKLFFQEKVKKEKQTKTKRCIARCLLLGNGRQQVLQSGTLRNNHVQWPGVLESEYVTSARPSVFVA
jgi:hypothetical protein